MTIPDLQLLHDGRPGLRSLVEVEVREAEASHASAATLDFVASTATLDRYHEIIEPAGWRLDSYRRNSVFQNAHNYGDVIFTLGKAVSTEVRAVGGGQALYQSIQFATEVNPVARIAYGLYKGGFLNAVPVGFIPLRWEDPSSLGGSGAASPAPRRRYLERELLEVSVVAIPANPDALALASGTLALGAGKMKLSDATLDDFRNLRLKVNKAAQNGPLSAYYLDSTWEVRLPAFKTSADPNVYQRLPDGSAILDGYPIIWTDVLEAYGTAAIVRFTVKAWIREFISSRLPSFS
jgi:phage head maturation protease